MVDVVKGRAVSVLPLSFKPDFSALVTLNAERYPALLESVASGTSDSRYDLLFAFPDQNIELDSENALSTSESSIQNKDFFALLDDACHATSISTQAHDWPFAGGWFVYLSYEVADLVEPVLDLPKSQDGLPKAVAIHAPCALIHDHESGQTALIGQGDLEQQWQHLSSDLQTIDQNVATEALIQFEEVSEEPSQRYEQGVEKIKHYIREGDVFQVNLSREWQVHCSQSVSIAQIYRQLSAHNPAPFAGLFSYKEAGLISSSPERLVQVDGGIVQTRPIAGTRPRSTGSDEDQQLKDELIQHPKEQAEHIMLLDLERNDLGRVCEPGSIEVNELMVLESYAHVHHIVSNVRGRLLPDKTPGQVLKAVFPGGTITGAPKVRCMEIIAELEQTGRGAYTGSMGYISDHGPMDFNILIRTMTFADQTLRFRAGAGIVYDSIPHKETDETRAKARGLLLALQAGKSA